MTPFEPGFEWDAVRALPQVEGLGLLATGRYTINGVGDPAETIYVIPADDQAMQAVDRPVVLAGRLADPSKPDEAVVTARYAELNGLTVGDTGSSVCTGRRPSIRRASSSYHRSRTVRA